MKSIDERIDESRSFLDFCSKITFREWALFFTSVPFVIACRVLWQYYPGLPACTLFWIIALADEPLRWRDLRGRRRTCYAVSTLGSLGNALATLANNGVMPVLGKEKATSLWVPLTDTTRLKWLCDIYSGASLGDCLIGIGLLGLLFNWLCEKVGVFDTEPPVPGKRLPGMGLN